MKFSVLKQLFEQYEINEELLKQVVRGEYKIDENGVISVDGDVVFTSQKFDILPFRFKEVTGKFVCPQTLVSLRGSPVICGSFYAEDLVHLKSLKDGPKIVKNVFSIARTPVTSLQGGPLSVGKIFDASLTEIKNLKDFPRMIDSKNAIVILKETELVDFKGMDEKNTRINTINVSDSSPPKTLEGIPPYINKLILSNCRIRTIDIPKYVKQINVLDLRDNPLSPCPPDIDNTVVKRIITDCE